MKKTLKNIPAYPVAMTVAGTDSGGGAGVAADLRTFNAFGVFGTCAIAAVTAQNPAEVRDFAAIAPELVAMQINTVMDKLSVRAVKTGMLADTAIVHAVAETLSARSGLKIVVDPVMVSTSGCKLLADEAVAAVKSELLPLASVITPNLPEAELLLGRKLQSEGAFADAAEELAEKFRCSCLLKTGHSENTGDFISDYYCRKISGGFKMHKLTSPRLQLPPLASHGTGCTLSSAVAALLAAGTDEAEAVRLAKAFVFGSLVESVKTGQDTVSMYPPEYDYSADAVLTSL